jgi:hypothetical protein
VTSTVRTGADVARKAAELARPREVPRPLRPWVRRVAAFGLFAKAVVYLALGVLATRAAIGWGGQTTDTRGAVEELGHQGGALTALLIGLGLLCYAAWRVVQAVTDSDRDGADWKGLGSRLGALGSAVGHCLLALTAFGVAAGIRARRTGGVPHWTARAMDEPLGALLVGLVGMGVLVAAAVQFRKAFGGDFFEKEHIDAARMGPAARGWALRLGRSGIAARGVTFGIIGFFLVRAALHTDPGEARGVAGALRFLRGLEHGGVFLAAVAVGLVAYGVYTLLLARYRRVGA